MNEIWSPIKGYEGLYEISNLGRVKALERVFPHRHGGERVQKEKMLKIYTHKQGYLFAVLCRNYSKKNYFIHRLIATAFIENPIGLPEVNHKDGSKSNNQISNLEWCDRMQNQHHAMKMGLTINLIGEEHGNSRLTDNEVIKIRELYSSENKKYRKDFSTTKLGEMFNVSQACVYDIVTRKTWRHI